jgi:hypothetical protein
VWVNLSTPAPAALSDDGNVQGPPAVRQNLKRGMRGSRGVTLVELTISLGLLALLSVSVIAVTFQVRSMSEQVVYQNTALTLAQGYMEQIRHLDYTTLKAVSQDSSSSVTLPLDKTTGAQVTPVTGSFFGNGTWATETIYLDQNAAGAPIQPLTFRFRPVLTSLETATAGVASGVEITIYYQITYNFGVTRSINGALRSVRSSVPTY